VLCTRARSYENSGNVTVGMNDCQFEKLGKTRFSRIAPVEFFQTIWCLPLFVVIKINT